jgi:hypothetical protein
MAHELNVDSASAVHRHSTDRAQTGHRLRAKNVPRARQERAKCVEIVRRMYKLLVQNLGSTAPPERFAMAAS